MSLDVVLCRFLSFKSLKSRKNLNLEIKNIDQPFLFPDMATVERVAVGCVQSKAKKLLRQLYKLRAQNSENPFIPEIQKLIDKVRNFGNATHTQIEETILYVIEVQMAYELTEIVEDTGLDRKSVENLLLHLESVELVRKVPKYIPGSDRQYYIYKSNRQNVQEMGSL